LNEGQALLVKSWQRTCTVGDCWTVSIWGNKPGQWTSNTRARVAEEVNAIKHWKFETDGMRAMRNAIGFGAVASTWFLDPMYQFNYQYRHKVGHDYAELGALAKTLAGQVIVCEAVCPETGKVPDWLPFTHFGNRITSRRKAENNHHSKELIWTNGLSVMGERECTTPEAVKG